MINHRRAKMLAAFLVIVFTISACMASSPKSTPLGSDISVTSTNTETNAPTAVQPSPTPQVTSTPAVFGPDENQFPPAYNPLTGQPVRDPSLLELPALLISISNFPPVARPQAGLSFADYVFEIYITEGATRFLSAFYGDFPFPEIPFKGDCEVRSGPFVKTETILGNQVWLDANGNGMQDYGEPGVGGVCVDLLDSSGAQAAQTTTDSNGYYGFDVQPGHYTVQFELPPGARFTQANVGDENHDSDADPVTGRAEADVTSDDLLVDAGLIPLVGATPAPASSDKLPKAEVGPVRSGRLIYADIAGFFQDSCLIYAFASPEVLSEIPKCSMVTHEDAGGGSMLEIARMQAIAEDNEKADTVFDYASNLYTDQPPAGGFPATGIDEFFALLNQSGWKYDPLYQSYLRYTDNADKASEGVLHPDTDRLNGRQLHFENVIVLFAEHDVVEPTNLDIHLEQGNKGPAYLFRDGQVYQIIWSTLSGEYEKTTGLRRPIQFLNKDGSQAALKPGHTWVVVVTPYSTVTDQGGGVWKIRFYAPGGSK